MHTTERKMKIYIFSELRNKCMGRYRYHKLTLVKSLMISYYIYLLNITPLCIASYHCKEKYNF